MSGKREGRGQLELWGGLECTINRVGDHYFDQFAKGGHLERPEDIDRIAALGVQKLRYPVLWERTAPDRTGAREWALADDRLKRLRNHGVDPIVGLVHHGSGPAYTSLVEDGFAPGLAAHAREVAERFPWVESYTPVNEPLTTARFSALYGFWYPHATDGRSFAIALLNQVKATVLSMREIRAVNPSAKLVQTDDLGKTHATAPLRYQADFENVRRWLTWDLLCGKVDAFHPMWERFVQDGIDERELGWFLDNPCPPDVIGINYYLTSERFLDHRLERYPARTHGGNAKDNYADVEAVRVLAGGIEGPSTLLEDAWERYGLPLAITECHLGCTREEQVRWLHYVWNEAETVRANGADVRAVTVWSMFGAYDWCTLLTCNENRYEPGVFDLRAPEPRPTALAQAVRDLADGIVRTDLGDGWWERPIRLEYPPVLTQDVPGPVPAKRRKGVRAPLLILGEDGPIERVLAADCELRGLEWASLTPEDIDLASPPSVRSVLTAYGPWAVIVTDGICETGGAEAATNLAAACAEVGARLVAFSCDPQFDGPVGAPHVESTPIHPGDYLRAVEESLLREAPDALIVRTGTPFAADDDGFARQALDAMRAGRPFAAACDEIVAPTYVPDLVQATLDLLIDGMEGRVHLVSEGAIAPADFARRIAQAAGLDEGLVVDTPHRRNTPPSRARYGALASERVWIMPTLEDALRRFLVKVEADEAMTAGLPYLS